MDGAIGLVILATPLLAIKFGAGAMMLGTIGWVPQLVRLPLCLTSGHLSERFGRKTIIVPAALTMAVGAYWMTFVKADWQIILPYTLVIGAIGAFYAPLQALVGDVSTQPGELTTNLGWYNIGWCVGGAVFAVAGTWLVAISLPLVLHAAVISMLIAVLIVLLWPTVKQHKDSAAPVDDTPPAQVYPPQLLLAARIAHFTGFFGVVSIRMLYPKLAKDLGWSDPMVARVLAALLAGMAVSMIFCKASEWWKGKFWPHAAALTLYLACGIGSAFLRAPILVGVCFFVVGGAVGVVYTAALYHGIADRKARGGNAGIHESLVAGGAVSACLIGGFIADKISLTAPYFAFAALSVIALAWAIKLWKDALYTAGDSL